MILDVGSRQVFAGYVLHTGPMPSSLKVGDEVFCEAPLMGMGQQLSIEF